MLFHPELLGKLLSVPDAHQSTPPKKESQCHEFN